ncbi:hypothetical protein K2173_028327 [Erythroxylum novogranatense]|uniref:RNase H type-1 domain-containing protein n=1 Tax=Erythroxylum novogranatense TaxID=1862640 RepID=A0AAV8U481_9ROSI|nr:hypothetical protein K2173_028327 [Erythroxylum novogranatense]
MSNCPRIGNKASSISQADGAASEGTGAYSSTTTMEEVQNCQPRGEWMMAAPRQRRPPRSVTPHPKKGAILTKESLQSKGANSGTHSRSTFDVLQDYVTVARPAIMGKNQGPALAKDKANRKGNNSLTTLSPPLSGDGDNSSANTQVAPPPSTPIPPMVSSSTPLPTSSAPSTSHTQLLKPHATSMPFPKSPNFPTPVAPTSSTLVSFPSLQLLASLPTSLASSTANPIPMQAHAKPPSGKFTKSSKKPKRSLPYSRVHPPSPIGPPTALTSSISDIHNCSSTGLLETTPNDQGKSNPMDVSFDTQGLGHQAPMEEAPIEDINSVLVDVGGDIREPDTSIMLDGQLVQDDTLGYNGQTFIDPIGFSGGIWVLWSQTLVQLNVLTSDRQYIHLGVQPHDGPKWLFIAIYASPRGSVRDSLWRDLTTIASSAVDPWLLAGDFNVIADSTERRGPPTLSTGVCNKFVRFIDHCHLLDLGFSGSAFTWSRGRIRKRLDRALANASWRTTFQEGLKIGNEWCFDPDTLREEATQFYRNLFSLEDTDTNIPADHLHRDVASYVVTNGVWDMVSLRPFLSSAILGILALSPTPNPGGDEDVVLWEHTSSGECTVKSAWRHNIMADHDAQDALGLQRSLPLGAAIWRSSIDFQIWREQQQSALVGLSPTLYTTLVGWEPPDAGWLKINTDGAVCRASGRSGAGGVFRYSDGKWVLGFTHHLKSCTPFFAELWAVYDALFLAWSNGFSNIVVEVDNSDVAALLNSSRPSRFDRTPLMECVHALLHRHWHVVIQHTFREANAVADALAKTSLSLEFGLSTFTTPPSYCMGLLVSDASGAQILRDFTM